MVEWGLVKMQTMFLGATGAVWVFREWAADPVAGRLTGMPPNLCHFEDWLRFDPGPYWAYLLWTGRGHGRVQ